ncbi:MAG: hypothetical protein LLF76_04660 [Planctomycetaceae bacterium]|nr:hypothetical protein [Planctomycetaceae bacterium]
MIKTCRKIKAEAQLQAAELPVSKHPELPGRPDDRLTGKQVSAEFGIPEGTLGRWRYSRAYDGRFPRYHKLFTGKVFYIRSEFEEDLRNMEVDTTPLMPLRRRLGK